MEALTQLLSLSNIILCLAIVALVWAQRKIAEVLLLRYLKKDLKKSAIWTELLVPIGPLGTGMLVMLVPTVPIPEMFSGGLLVKMVFGLGLGLVSGLVYRLTKKNILDKIGKAVDQASDE